MMSKCYECGFEMPSGARRWGHCGVQYVKESSTGPVCKFFGAVQGACVSAFASYIFQFNIILAVPFVVIFTVLGWHKGFIMTATKK